MFEIKIGQETKQAKKLGVIWRRICVPNGSFKHFKTELDYKVLINPSQKKEGKILEQENLRKKVLFEVVNFNLNMKNIFEVIEKDKNIRSDAESIFLAYVLDHWADEVLGEMKKRYRI